jgi:hypothetical protein
MFVFERRASRGRGAATGCQTGNNRPGAGFNRQGHVANSRWFVARHGTRLRPTARWRGRRPAATDGTSGAKERHEAWRTATFKSNLRRLRFSGSGHRSTMTASATPGAPVPTSLLRAPLTNAFGNSSPSLHLRIICMRFTPLRKVNWSLLFCPLGKSLNSSDCGIFFNRNDHRTRLRLDDGAVPRYWQAP